MHPPSWSCWPWRVRTPQDVDRLWRCKSYMYVRFAAVVWWACHMHRRKSIDPLVQVNCSESYVKSSHCVPLRSVVEFKVGQHRARHFLAVRSVKIRRSIGGGGGGEGRRGSEDRLPLMLAVPGAWASVLREVHLSVQTVAMGSRVWAVDSIDTVCTKCHVYPGCMWKTCGMCHRYLNCIC